MNGAISACASQLHLKADVTNATLLILPKETLQRDFFKCTPKDFYSFFCFIFYNPFSNLPYAMEPINCTHENFDFTRTTKTLKRIIKVKQKPRRKCKPIDEVVEEEEVDTFSLQDNNLPNVLSKCTIYIHHTTNRTKLKVIAEGLGAVVVSEMTNPTTHLVIEPKGDPKATKIVKQAAAKGIICASPQWLTECYEKREYLSAIHFPYAMEKDTHVLGSDASEIAPLSNPFGTDYIDFDAQENRRANGGQTNLDGFITRRQENNASVEEHAAGPSTPFESHQQFGHVISLFENQSDDAALNTQGTLDEHEEMKREFYYNDSRSSATSNAALPESEEDLLEQRRQAEERVLRANQAIQEKLSRVEKDPPRAKKTLQSGFGERLRIWYGEHSVRPLDAKKKRAVQSVLGPHQQRQLRPPPGVATTSSASTSANSAASNTRRTSVQHHLSKKPKI